LTHNSLIGRVIVNHTLTQFLSQNKRWHILFPLREKHAVAAVTEGKDSEDGRKAKGTGNPVA
jgi:hypothetical protein